jgi:hypothetical protein
MYTAYSKRIQKEIEGAGYDEKPILAVIPRRQKRAPGVVIDNAASAGWDTACRMLGECRHGGLIDRKKSGTW